MLFSACVVGAYNSPSLGNGFVAWKTGPNCKSGQPCMDVEPPTWNGVHTDGPHGGGGGGNEHDGGRLGDTQATLGGLHMAGVFSGTSNNTVSHRARIPSVLNVQVGGDGLTAVGAGLDLRGAMLMNRTLLNVSGVCTAELEHRVYAHRSRMNLCVGCVALPSCTRCRGTGCSVFAAAAAARARARVCVVVVFCSRITLTHTHRVCMP